MSAKTSPLLSPSLNGYDYGMNLSYAQPELELVIRQNPEIITINGKCTLKKDGPAHVLYITGLSVITGWRPDDGSLCHGHDRAMWICGPNRSGVCLRTIATEDKYAGLRRFL